MNYNLLNIVWDYRNSFSPLAHRKGSEVARYFNFLFLILSVMFIVFIAFGINLAFQRIPLLFLEGPILSYMLGVIVIVYLSRIIIDFEIYERAAPFRSFHERKVKLLGPFLSYLFRTKHISKTTSNIPFQLKMLAYELRETKGHMVANRIEYIGWKWHPLYTIVIGVIFMTLFKFNMYWMVLLGVLMCFIGIFLQGFRAYVFKYTWILPVANILEFMSNNYLEILKHAETQEIIE